MHGGAPEWFRQREIRSIEFWVVGPVMTVVGLIVLLVIGAPRWWWVGVGPLLLYPALMVKIAMGRMSRAGNPGLRSTSEPGVVRDSILYAVAVVLGKFPQYLGVRKFRAAHRRGLRSEIIEYKGPASPPASPLAGQS